jgi:hypothetical protein
MISIKTYAQGKEVLVAACDEELLGRRLEEGIYNLFVSKEFYDGVRGEKTLLKKHLENATIANLVGENAVTCAIELGFVSRDHVLEIDGVPHAQVVVLDDMR